MHNARKSCKRVRAAVRLIRDEIGEALYKLGRDDKAAEAYKKVTANYTQSEKLPQAYYRLGEITS